jgi:hypothetical protein
VIDMVAHLVFLVPWCFYLGIRVETCNLKHTKQASYPHPNLFQRERSVRMAAPQVTPRAAPGVTPRVTPGVTPGAIRGVGVDSV